MSDPYTYFYDRQIRRYIGQFLRIFKEFYVRYEVDRDGDGSNDTRDVKVYYGDIDRVAGAILQDQKSFHSDSLPIIAGNLTSIEKRPSDNFPQQHVDRRVLNESGARTVNRQLMPIPVTLRMEVNLLTSSTNELFEIMEQVILIFGSGGMYIETSDNILDPTTFSQVTLTQTGKQSNFPIGTQARAMMGTMSFDIDAYLAYPSNSDNDIINEIITTIKQDPNVDLTQFTVDENS